MEISEGRQYISNNCGSKGADTLLVTANVGSLFEDPENLLQPWIKEFLLKVCEINPDFLALHLQEVGGKTYEKSMESVQKFIKNLCEADALNDYSCIEIFMDEDYKSAEHFTALGNLYFIRENLTPVKIWNFFTQSWEISKGKNIYSGNIESIATKEKAKFPQHFFPECKWSRKGFMRTRWEINGTVLDLINIHLFHDASNLAACEESPSVYCKTRRRALVHTLERFHLDKKNGLVPFFVFGDFNFRCDGEGVVKELTKNLTAHRVHNTKHDTTKVHYRNSEGNNVLTLGKKEFFHADHQLKFKESWLKKHDRELQPLLEILFEYPIEFAPTYPYEEDPDMPTDYMSTRCPAWCDRVLMSITAKKIIDEIMGDKTNNTNNAKENPYSTIGENICMGDHKPIYLHIKLKPNQGTYISCKCHFNCTHINNKSTSHTKLASVDTAKSNGFNLYCPYDCQIYNETLLECNKLKKRAEVCLIKDAIRNDGTRQASDSSSPMNKIVLNHYPAVSINIFDPYNINVCACSQLMNATPENDDDDVDGAMCQECRNIIKRQPQKHRRTLISKRLVLANNIIVNRIDTQYLSTHFDCAQPEQHEPYTPESAESHSPYPEPDNSTTTTITTSSRYHSNFENVTQEHRTESNVLQCVQAAHSSNSSLLAEQNDSDSFEMSPQRRGIISAGQLKSRLEDLQRSSLNLLNYANSVDVDNVDEQCQKEESLFEKQKWYGRVSGCCNIC